MNTSLQEVKTRCGCFYPSLRKIRNFTQFYGVEILWKGTVSAVLGKFWSLQKFRVGG